jgi:hypothetical protein
MNSTFLECTDLLFRHKGMSTIMLPIPFGTGFFLFVVLQDIFSKEPLHPASLNVTMAIFSAIFLLIFLFLLSCEYFRYTHYPTRFNRKTRKVYKYNWDGTVMVEDWDKLHFALSTPFLDSQKVAVIRLAEDGETVLDDFPLPFSADKDEPLLLSQWEFVRRYMEEPKELPQLASQIITVEDVHDRRETWWGGFKRLAGSWAGGFRIMFILLFPISVIFSLGRWLVMRTNTVPAWPEEVERDCQIEPNDPYLRDRDHLAPPDAA